ncbi:CRISPR-associated endonuclease Cas1 [uncultured Shewanella sp.]|uniref:CRISPR-associated endonuclease Cas1 n=1 Tax=uncultured Shewanella sp. TaxID=173975 RepID=UPI002631815A|nr:CRISPR-associated endonuclease Cas1 [uncultured Shewanella sp.]
MSMMVLDEKDYALSVRDGMLSCEHPDKGRLSMPWGSLTLILIGRQVKLSSDVLLALARHEIQVLFIGDKGTDPASLMPMRPPGSDIRFRQYRVCYHSEASVRLSRKLVTLKTLQQSWVLHKLGLGLPPGWNNMVDTLKQADNLMLQEARLSHLYWQQWAGKFAYLGFHGRNRRPPKDPLNALISLASVMEDGLHGKALLAQGLDIGLGVHHATGYRRQSLICDTKELTRGRVEVWVAKLFLSATIDTSLFDISESGCRLTSAGQAIFYPAWHKFAATHEGRVKRVARIVRHTIEREASR